ncbi:hypothetical protein [Parachlamydia acanthamoebae]|uniref:Uncharacterized protein n=1 Tax=Parachlamydia acanthamoebae TaxID=83552 RepID=A0A0C1ECE1_9BACT|nr:hypothetical protein [Parachlamydia acanthamoebae]KIA78777.1 hypothetical protein DB43_DH00020 [Parachlamydia acanthamoebae]
MDIKHEIKTLKKRLIKSGFSYSQLKEFNKDDAAQEDQKRFIEDNPEVPEIYEKITILKMILTIDNIEVLDLKSDISRQRVEKKLSQFHLHLYLSIWKIMLWEDFKNLKSF